MYLSRIPGHLRPPGTSILSSAPDDDDDDGVGIRESRSSRRPGPKLLSLGRVLSILLDAEPKELESVRAQLKSRLQPKGSVGQAAIALIHHVMDMNSSHSSMEQIFIPVLEHAVKSKEHSNRKRAACILEFLLERDEVAEKAASELAAIARTHQTNNRVKLGWCVVVREIVQGWSGQGCADNPLHSAAFASLVSCIPQLEQLALMASVHEDNKKLPTRLSVVAADCMLAITKAIAVGSITKKPEKSLQEKRDSGQYRKPLITPIETSPDDVRSGFGSNDNGSDVAGTSSRDLFSSSERRNMALWDQLDNLVSLVGELYEWNYRSRPLYARGLERVEKRLRSLAQYRDSLKVQQAKEGDISIGAEVLVASWQHYGGLLMTEDKSLYSHPQPILQHWLGALQYFVQENDDSNTDEETTKTQEMRGYALACLALTLGRLDARRLETVLEEFEPQLLNVLFSQLRGGDNVIIELAVGILRAILFRPPVAASDSGKGTPASRLETVVPMLMEMLDTRDMAARAVVLLVAEYFAAKPEAAEFEELFSRLDAEDSLQRRNALDVLTELFSICTRNTDVINSPLSQTIASHLFKRLGDTELTNRVEASALFASLDPSFTLPTLVDFLYSPDARVRSAASAGVLSVMKRSGDQSRVIAELLDCVAKVVKEHQTKTAGPKGSATISDTSPLDFDRVMRLIPEWASKVENWCNIIELLLKKMFDEPANAVIPRFLSSISQQLAENTHILFPLLLKKFDEQPQLTEAYISELSEGDSGTVASHLFARLSPLLVLRVLPLSAFDDIRCKGLYGGLTSAFRGNGRPDMDSPVCITDHLLSRACGAFEFEDVRKVASEITGRLVPEILLPLITAQLEDATKCMDILRVKACLYSICTSLVIRAKDSINHSLMEHIRKIISSILLWPSLVEEKGFSDVTKAQHGSIDCLALMICAEARALTESVSDEDSAGHLGTRGQPVGSVRPLKAEQPESNLPANMPSLKIAEESSSKKSNSSLSRPLLEIVEESYFAEEPVEEIGRETQTVQGSIQLIEKLPESEQLKSRSFARKEVSLLSREINKVEKVERELSNRKIEVLDRLSEREQHNGNGTEEPQLLSEETTSIGADQKLKKNEQLCVGKSEDRMHQLEGQRQNPVESKIFVEELAYLERTEEQSEENIQGGTTQQGPKPKVLIEELSEPERSRRKLLKGGKANGHRSVVLTDVIDCLTGHVKKLPWSSLNADLEVSAVGTVTRENISVPLAFRICMANVLISACQKISLGDRTAIAAKMIPPLARFVEVSNDSKLKAACLQVLFTAVYHLKAPSILPFASDLMILSLRAIKSHGPFEERMGGAKLLASLLASEEVLVRELTPHLLDAQVALSSISAIDSSPEMRALCEKLLSCLSVPGDGVD